MSSRKINTVWNPPADNHHNTPADGRNYYNPNNISNIYSVFGNPLPAVTGSSQSVWENSQPRSSQSIWENRQPRSSQSIWENNHPRVSQSIWENNQPQNGYTFNEPPSNGGPIFQPQTYYSNCNFSTYPPSQVINPYFRNGFPQSSASSNNNSYVPEKIVYDYSYKTRSTTSKNVAATNSMANQYTSSSLNYNVYSNKITNSPFHIGSKILRFPLCTTPFECAAFQVSNAELYSFEKSLKSLIGFGPLPAVFATRIDKWPKSFPSNEAVIDAAKFAIMIVHKKGMQPFLSIVGIIIKRWEGRTNAWPSHTVAEQMILLYLMHVIMAIEIVNCDLRFEKKTNFCEKFEDYLTNQKSNAFRVFTTKATFEQKEELHSLRCRWDAYFSAKALAIIDRDNFWRLCYGNNSQANNSSRSTIYKPTSQVHNRSSTIYKSRCQVNNSCSSTIYKPTSQLNTKGATKPAALSRKTVEIEDIDENDNNDNLKVFNLTMDNFLSCGWLEDFPLSEQDKRRFTSHFSVKNPTGDDVVCMYAQNVEFKLNQVQRDVLKVFPSPVKLKIVDFAKEALYIASVFGKQKAFVVAAMITGHMAMKTSFQERITSLFVIHVILVAESLDSKHKNQLKIERPYSNAFSTDTFVQNFQNLVAALKNRVTKQKLYWMRIVWNSCLLDEYLSKIDDHGFWRRNNVIQKELPAKFQLKKKLVIELADSDDDEVSVVAHIDKTDKREEVALILLLSSDDENEREEDERRNRRKKGKCSSIDESERSPIEIFHEYHNNWWTKAFSMPNAVIAGLRQKYKSKQQAEKNEQVAGDDASLAVETFKETVFDIFLSVEERKFLDAAKEAFFVETAFGYGCVHDIAQFLVRQIQNGFEFCKSPESIESSRLIAFLIIHIIIAIDSVEPIIVPNITERSYVKSFKYLLASNALTWVKDIQNVKIRSKVKFLALTWVGSEEESRGSRKINSLYKTNCTNEPDFMKDVISYISGLSQRHRTDAEFEKEKIKARNRKRAKDTVVGPKANQPRLRRERIEKRKTSTQEESVAKKARSLQNLFVPDVIKVVLPISKSKSNGSQSVKQITRPRHGTSRSTGLSSSTSTGLLGPNGQPLHIQTSVCEKNMELTRKMLRERNGGKEKGRKPDREEQSHSVPIPIVQQIKIVDNFQSEQFSDFANNLLDSSNIDIVYSKEGAKVKLTHTA